MEEVGRIRVSRKREVTARMEEEEFDTEADYFEGSAPRQNDICSQVGALAFLEIQVNLDDTCLRGWSVSWRHFWPILMRSRSADIVTITSAETHETLSGASL